MFSLYIYQCLTVSHETHTPKGLQIQFLVSVLLHSSEAASDLGFRLEVKPWKYKDIY